MRNYKKNSTGKIVGIVAIVLVLILAVGALGWLTKGFQNWDPSTWIEKKPDEPDEEEEDSDILFNPGDEDGLSLSAVVSGNSTVVTATVKDSAGESGTALQSVTWSLDWSTGGTGNVSDFMTMTTDGIQATLTLKAAFGYQIILTCTSTLAPSVKATATLDYYKRLTGATVNLNSTDTTVALSDTVVNLTIPDFSTIGDNYGHNPTWEGTTSIVLFNSAVFGTGTVGGTVSSYEIGVRFNGAFGEHLSNISYPTEDFEIYSSTGNASAPFTLQSFFGQLGLFNTFYSYDYYYGLTTTTNQLRVELAFKHYNGITERASYFINISATLSAVSSVNMNDTNFVF